MQNTIPFFSLICLVFSTIFGGFGIFFLKTATRFSRTARSMGTRRKRNWLATACFGLTVAFFATACFSLRR